MLTKPSKHGSLITMKLESALQRIYPNSYTIQKSCFSVHPLKRLSFKTNLVFTRAGTLASKSNRTMMLYRINL